ncbi:MAG: Fic family protein [Chitinophagaceae bacterium]|nr:MAG: Fic family protein [Chitinophagaceae bacterium]
MKVHSLLISPGILATVAEIEEFRGTWRALGQLAAERLNLLKKVATIESIGSSTRIEGSKLTDSEVEKLLSILSTHSSSSRDEQEVIGYSEVMDLIFQNYDLITISENYIKQLHGQLLKHSDKDSWHKGEYKKSANHVEAFDASGNSLGIVFETSSPFETPLRMQQLVDWANQTLSEKSLHPLLVAAIFIVEFLAIHPFQDGNGRLSRVLTTFILLRSGYAYIPYSSLEAIIEANKDRYYLALRQTQSTLSHTDPDWQPWISFFLQSLKKQKDRLQVKMDREKMLAANLPELALQITELVKSTGRITIKELVSLTKGNRNTIKKHLELLVNNNHIVKNGEGKGSWYSKI